MIKGNLLAIIACLNDTCAAMLAVAGCEHVFAKPNEGDIVAWLTNRKTGKEKDTTQKCQTQLGFVKKKTGLYKYRLRKTLRVLFLHLFLYKKGSHEKNK